MNYEAMIKSVQEDISELRQDLKECENYIDEWEPDGDDEEITERMDDEEDSNE